MASFKSYCRHQGHIEGEEQHQALMRCTRIMEELAGGYRRFLPLFQNDEHDVAPLLKLDLIFLREASRYLTPPSSTFQTRSPKVAQSC